MNFFRKYCCFLLLVVLLLCVQGPQLYASSRLALSTLTGSVNREEIGQGDCTVFSLWNGPQGIPVKSDNSFTAVVSGQRPQKITLVDSQKRIKALAIVIPGFTREIVFDARSTASAVLLTDSEVFVQSQQVTALLKRMEQGQMFQAFVEYLRRNLSSQPLSGLVRNDEYIRLVENCQKEIFGEDPQAIRASLKTAEQELEKVMK